MNRLRPYVTEKPANSRSHRWDRLAPTAAVQKTTKRADTPYQDGVWTGRVSTPETWHWADTYEEEDIVQMLTDPNSALTRSGAMAMGRAQDDIIIAAATGNATDHAGASQTFPVGQTVGDATTVFSFDLVTEVFEKFTTNDIEIDIPKVFVIGPTQLRKLQQLVEYTSSDYANVKALAESGYVPNWMGFNWVLSNRLNVPGANQIDCLAFTPYAIGMQMNMDTITKVAEDPSKSFAWTIYMQWVAGAVRVEDEHIVRVHLLNSLA
jgi:hypothetical protein